jgi:DNA-binding LacI/PurR family transcriptional regulator
MKRRSTSKRPTSRDVAELAGVSQTTVSHVINNKWGGNIRISEETRRKVWEAVGALKYRPIAAARTLRTKRSNMVAVIIPHVQSLFQPRFAAIVQEEAEKENLDVMIYHTHDDLKRELDTWTVLPQRDIQGVFTQSYLLSSADLDPFVEAGMDVVIHGNSPTHPFVDNVMIDEAKAVEEAVSYLIGQGHRRIGTIAGPQTMWTGRLRKEGYLNALQAHDIPTEEKLIREADYKRGYGVQAMQELMTLAEPPTAVFAANDILAIDALLYAVDSGLSVPDDVAIVGFDDLPEATIVRPRLTTVRKDVDLLATAAVQMMIQRRNSEELLPSRQKVLDHELIVRESA